MSRVLTLLTAFLQRPGLAHEEAREMLASTPMADAVTLEERHPHDSSTTSLTMTLLKRRSDPEHDLLPLEKADVAGRRSLSPTAISLSF